jgi:outer membrane protein assembly factor BamE (lipoprotein component of BamABCDE complex)
MMKKTLIAAAAAVLPVLLLGLLAISSGCGDSTAAGSNNLTPEKYNRIEIGMSTDQVKLIAGNPIKRNQEHACRTFDGER